MSGFYYSPNTDQQLLNPQSQLPYDINYAVTQQTLKNTNAQLRFKMSVQINSTKTYTFQAHLDPNHLVDEQNKRLVQIDVLTGVILQDFGYMPETLELRGSTGSQYYKEIQTLDTIFNNQSRNGRPTPVSITIQERTYSVVWRSFSFDQQQTQAGGNVVNYTMSFVILNRGLNVGSGTASDVSSGSSVAAQNKINNSTIYNNGQALIVTVSTNGLSVYDYLKSVAQIPYTQIDDAVTYVENNWDPIINGGAYPGDTVNLLPNQVITVPSDWSNVLS